MRKLILLVLVLAVCATAPAAVITSVVRANGTAYTGTATASQLQTVPPSTFDGFAQPLPTEVLSVGSKVFSDRAVHNFSGVPGQLNLSEYVRTFNTDKAKAETDVTYTITTSSAATVWVTIDDRSISSTLTGWGATAPWLTLTPGVQPTMQMVADFVTSAVAPAGTFTDSGLDLLVYESTSTTGRMMSVFKADLAAGTYAFGQLPHGSLNFYTVGIVPEPATMALLGLGSMALIRRRR